MKKRSMKITVSFTRETKKKKEKKKRKNDHHFRLRRLFRIFLERDSGRQAPNIFMCVHLSVFFNTKVTNSKHKDSN